MKTNAIAFAVLICIAQSYLWSQSNSPTPVKPEVTLTLSDETMDVPSKNGKTSFRVDAVASEGFIGTISGSITVPQASNPNRVDLIKGADTKDFYFTLAAGQKLSDTQSIENRTFTIWTSPGNSSDGPLQYGVVVNPSTQYATVNSPKLVKVNVGATVHQ